MIVVGPAEPVLEQVRVHAPDAILCAGFFEPEVLSALMLTGKPMVLVDMNLPDMTGLGLRGRMLADQGLVEALQGTRWVALSADDPPEVVRAARAAGFHDYWLKPIDVTRMQDNLQRLLAA